MADTPPCTCPEIRDQDWHMKDQDWSGKFFYFEDLPHFFNVPLQYDRKLQMMKEDIARKGYRLLAPDMVLYLPGSFQGRIMMEIADPEQYDANVDQFDDARVLSRVVSGPRNRLSDAIEELKAFAEDRTHIAPGKVYYWYVTCARCARTRGGDKTVLFARV